MHNSISCFECLSHLIDAYRIYRSSRMSGDRPKPWEINCSSVRGAALRRDFGRLAVIGEAGIPAGEVGGQVVVEDPGADLQEQMGALW